MFERHWTTDVRAATVRSFVPAHLEEVSETPNSPVDGGTRFSIAVALTAVTPVLLALAVAVEGVTLGV